MPHKHNAAKRHRIPKMKRTVTNWPEYEAGLRRRGSLTLWVEELSLKKWQSVGPKGQARYSAVSIETTLMLRSAFKMTLRQTEGLMSSILTLMNQTITAPDHTTVSRRSQSLALTTKSPPLPKGAVNVLIDSTGLKIFGSGQWLEEKHGAKSRKRWHKLHLAVDAESGQILAHVLTDEKKDDPSQVGPLLSKIHQPIRKVTADGAYDTEPTYQTIIQCAPSIDVVIPPRKTAIFSDSNDTLKQRDEHIDLLQTKGRLAWQKTTDYGKRALVETTMGRYKSLIGPCLRARLLSSQKTEAAIGVAVLNRMLDAGRPKSVKSLKMAP
jgi:hypothetical protein